MVSHVDLHSQTADILRSSHRTSQLCRLDEHANGFDASKVALPR